MTLTDRTILMYLQTSKLQFFFFVSFFVFASVVLRRFPLSLDKPRHRHAQQGDLVFLEAETEGSDSVELVVCMDHRVIAGLAERIEMEIGLSP